LLLGGGNLRGDTGRLTDGVANLLDGNDRALRCALYFENVEACSDAPTTRLVNPRVNVTVRVKVPVR
jgi:hypothetical protein